MKSRWMLPLNLFLLLALLAACGSEANGDVPHKTNKDKVTTEALQINGRAISLEDYKQALYERYGSIYLETYIEDQLLEEQARKAGVQLSQAEVDKMVQQEIDRLQTSRFGGSETAMRTALRENGTTLEAWRVELAARNRRKLLLDALVQHARTADSPAVKRKFEQQYGEEGLKIRLRHVLVSDKVLNTRFYDRAEFEKDLPQVHKDYQALGQELLKKLEGGADFAKLAQEHSDDFTASRGGALGGSWKSRFGDAFDKAVDQLQPGQTSGLIQGSRGYHILQVTGIQKGVEFQGSAILVSLGPKGPADARPEDKRMEDARQKVQQIQAELKEGKPFEDVAKRLSDDVATKARGGDLGTFGRRRLGNEVAQVLESIEPGTVSEAIESPRGFWLIKLDKRTYLPKADQREVRHILLSTRYDDVKRRRLEEKLPQMALERAQSLLKQLEGGVDFAKLAREESEDAYTRKAGGEYYNYRSTSLGKEVWEAAKALPVGQRKIVKSDRGYHILEVMERTQTKFEDVKAELLKGLGDQAAAPGDARALLEGLKQDAQIQCLGPLQSAPACKPLAAPASAPASAPAQAPAQPPEGAKKP